MDRRARPQGGQRVIILVVALAAGAAGCWLARAVDSAPQPGWLVGMTVGSAIAALVVWFAMLGTRVTVDAGGVLVYSLHGRPNLSFDIRAVTIFRPVDAGLALGIGVEFADPRIVRFLHKSGVSPERMRRWREALGVDLVLEGFPAGLADELTHMRDALPPAGTGAVGVGT
jgi:hypothetical protein